MTEKMTLYILDGFAAYASKDKHKKVKTCPICGCMFAYTDEKDVFFDDSLDHNVVACPDCEFKMKVTKEM